MANRKRQITVLAAASALAVGLAVGLGLWQSQTTQPVAPGGPLFPDYAARLESAAEFTAQSATHRFVIRRGEGNQWVMADRDNYPVDEADLRRALRAVGELTRIEAMTDNPDFYSRLGVGDPAQDKDATRYTVKAADGAVLADFVAGRFQQRAMTGRPAEFYARRSDETRAWLVRGDWDAGANPLEWLDRQILRIDRARVESVAIQHRGGEELRLRPARVQDVQGTVLFEIVNLPRGRTPTSEGDVNGIAGALEFLAFDEVASAAARAPDFDQAPVTALFRIKEGFDVRVALWPQPDGKAWARVRFLGTPQGEAAQEMADLKARVEPWAFLLAEFRARDLTRRLADITE